MRSFSRSFFASFLASVTCVTLAGCGNGAPPASATGNHVFYVGDDQVAASSAGAIERPYPPLDKNAQGDLPAYTGVALFGGTVHLSRPSNWKIRRASVAEGRRFVEYVSPNEYLFAVYERADVSSGDSWNDLVDQYTKDVKAKGGELVGENVPVATYSAQGREFIVKRTVIGQRAPYIHLSSEVMLRGHHRVAFVQIVHQGESLAPIGGELLRVMETLDLR